MDVGVELALGFNAREAAERHVFADLANEALADFFKRGIADLAGGEGFDVGRVLFGNGADGVSSHLQEFRVLGNEVRFGVDFRGWRRGLRYVGKVDSDDAFGSDAGGGLSWPCCRSLTRRISSALAMSPSASVRAFLHSIIGASVLTRSSLTIAAVIAAMFTLLEYQ